MALGAIELATIARTQDYTTIKQNDDAKGMVGQNHIAIQQHKEEEHHVKQVREEDNADWQNKKFDARDKGNGEYTSDGGQKKRRPPQEDGKVMIKGQGRIDIKI